VCFIFKQLDKNFKIQFGIPEWGLAGLYGNKINEGFCVSNLNVRNSYLIKGVMFEPLGLKEAPFIGLEFQRKGWLIQNL